MIGRTLSSCIRMVLIESSGVEGGGEGLSLDAYIENVPKRWGQNGEHSFYRYVFLVLIMLVKP